MFRRLPTNLPSDATYPANLHKLGLFIDPSTHQVKHIEHPTDSYRYAVTANERHNQVREESVNTCIRSELVTRLSQLGVTQLWLPELSYEKPEAQSAAARPSLPVFATGSEGLGKAKRVVLIVGRLAEDAGIWDWRGVRGDVGIEGGSVVGFVRDVLGRSFVGHQAGDVGDGEAEEDGDTAIIVANPGQLLYSYKHARAMTLDSWGAMPRPSALHMAPLIDETMNRVERSETPEKHLTFVIERVLMDESIVSRSAKVLVVAVGDAADLVLKLMEECWTTYSKSLNLAAIALISPLPLHLSTSPLTLNNAEFLSFLARRGRTWALSGQILNRALANATTKEKLAELMITQSAGGAQSPNDEIHLTPAVSCGVEVGPEEVMSQISKAVVDWFEEVVAGDAESDGYSNEQLEIAHEVVVESLPADWANGSTGAWPSDDPSSLI